MSMLTYVLPGIIEIVSLSAALKLECKRYTDGDLAENGLISNTLEFKDKLHMETRELNETIRILGASNKELLNCCSDIARRIDGQANRISIGLQQPLNIQEVMNGLQEVDAHLQILGNTLCAHYDEMASRREKDSLLIECYKKVFQAVKRHPIPIFETDLEEYAQICTGVTIEYARDERFSFNRKMLQFPGIVLCIMGMIDARGRDRLLSSAREYVDKIRLR